MVRNGMTIIATLTGWAGFSLIFSFLMVKFILVAVGSGL
jgi:hypothetical protein